MQSDLFKIITEHLKSYSLIEFAYIFGSYAKGKERFDSDIDVAVYIGQENRVDDFDFKMKIKIELEEIFKKQVDVIILNTANPLLKHQVFKYGKLLLCKDKALNTELKIKSFYEYLDYNHAAEIILASNKKRIRKELENGR